MAQIIPIRDLRKCAELSERVHKSNEPIFITRNGYGDMVIMSIEFYEKNFAGNIVYDAITESVEQVKNGAKPSSAKDVFAKLESKYVKK